MHAGNLADLADLVAAATVSPHLPLTTMPLCSLRRASLCFAVHAGVAGQPVTLTPGMVFFIGRAFALWLKRKLAQDGHTPSISVRAAGWRRRGGHVTFPLVLGLHG